MNILKSHFVHVLFIIIGVAIGIILSLQIRAQPNLTGSFPLQQIETQRELFNTFAVDQEDLKKKLADLEEKAAVAEQIIEQRSSRETLATLESLRSRTGFSAVKAEGIRITLRDNATASRGDYSNINELFVQASDVRDLINALFAKNAQAISLNNIRITPLTPIKSVFDSILVSNIQISPPFIIEAVGIPNALKEAVHIFDGRKIQVRVETPTELLAIPEAKNTPFISIMSLVE